jgi:hypothetical protein
MIQSFIAVLAGPFVMVAFDTLLHGLSHTGHGPLDTIWLEAKGERSSSLPFLSAIGWHVVADVLLGLLIFVLVAVLEISDLAWGALTGAVVGGIVALYWLHVYAAFETSGKTVAALAVLSLLQITLATIVVTIAYGAA